jgi:protein TonB
MVKPVVWQRTGTLPTWAIATLVLGALIAIAVWVSARQFVADDALARSGPSLAPEPAQLAGAAAPPAPVAAPAAAADRAPSQGLPADPLLSVAPASNHAEAPTGAAASSAVSAPAVHPAAASSVPAPAANPAAASSVPAPTGGALHVRKQVAPEIPKVVRDRGITSGHVSVVLHVDPQGRVERVELLSATPADVYDRNMEQVFTQWLFEPLGIPGRMTVDIDIRPPRSAQ